MTSSYSTIQIRANAVAAVRDGMRRCDVAAAYGIDRSTLYRWIQRSKVDSVQGLDRKRSPGSARPRTAPGLSKDALLQLVLTPASQLGFETDLWTTRRLESTLNSQGYSLSRRTVNRRLDEYGITYQKAQRIYFDEGKEKSDAQIRTDWLVGVLPEIRETVRKYKAILYFEDEAHIALSPVVGRTWSPRGQTPKVAATSKRGGFSAISAISGKGHLLFQLHDHRIATDEVIGFLSELLAHHKRRHLVVVMDNASPHTSKRLREYVASQKRLHVFYFPPRSPDWNPDEQVWNHLKNHEMNSHRETDKAGVMNLAFRKLEGMAADANLLKGIFLRSNGANLMT